MGNGLASETLVQPWNSDWFHRCPFLLRASTWSLQRLLVHAVLALSRERGLGNSEILLAASHLGLLLLMTVVVLYERLDLVLYQALMSNVRIVFGAAPSRHQRNRFILHGLSFNQSDMLRFLIFVNALHGRYVLFLVNRLVLGLCIALNRIKSDRGMLFKGLIVYGQEG